jgi:hypothetical protein
MGNNALYLDQNYPDEPEPGLLNKYTIDGGDYV